MIFQAERVGVDLVGIGRNCCRVSLEVKYVAGGATLNSIRVAQWMLQDIFCGSNAAAIEKATEAAGSTELIDQLVDVDGCAFPWDI